MECGAGVNRKIPHKFRGEIPERNNWGVIMLSHTGIPLPTGTGGAVLLAGKAMGERCGGGLPDGDPLAADADIQKQYQTDTYRCVNKQEGSKASICQGWTGRD